MASYGAIPAPVGLGRKRTTPAAAAAGLVALAVVAVAGIVISSRSATVLEGKAAATQLTRTFSGESVTVPATYVDFSKGTTFSPQSPFENSAMDKSARTQQLSNGDAVDDRAQVDKHAPHETKYIGTIPVDETVDGMARPVGDVKHLNCYGRDDDPECQTSVMPLFDKAKAQELSAQQAEKDLDKYFKQQQQVAKKVRKPIQPKMYGSEKLVDAKGTKYGLSAAAARKQMDAIFGNSKPQKVMKATTTQQLRWANNHGKASKIPAHLDAFPTQAATADALQFFDKLNAGPHGANNGALYDANKHPKPQFKVAGGQQLNSKHAHHGYSTQMANADLNNFYHSMPASNNHHLKDKHADRYSDPHTAFLKGHEATLPKKHGARKASATQMLRSNRDDAFLGDNSPVTKPGTLVKYASGDAAQDMSSFYSGLKKTRYGANNGHLKDATAQPNRARGEYHGETSAKALSDIDGYFSSIAEHKAAKKQADAAHAKRALDADHAASDINKYFAAMAPKVKHADAKLDPKLDADTATKDLNGFFSSLAKGKHGANNGHLHAKNGHAAATAKEHGNKKLSAPESREDINEYYGGKQLATAPAEQPNKVPKQETIGDISTDAELDSPMFQGYKHKIGMQHPDAHEVDDKLVDPANADCGDNKDCTSSRSPLLYKGDKRDSSLKTSGADAMSAAKADKDISTYFKHQDKEIKDEAKVEEKAAAKVGLSAQAARSDAKAYFHKLQKLSEYGVGPEDDHKIVINQAMGVDAMMPESMFTSNPEPSDETLGEVNEAIQAQRNEGYTNGDGMPAEDVVTP